MTRLDLATLWRDENAVAAFKGHSADVPSTRRLRSRPCSVRYRSTAAVQGTLAIRHRQPLALLRRLAQGFRPTRSHLRRPRSDRPRWTRCSRCCGNPEAPTGMRNTAGETHHRV